MITVRLPEPKTPLADTMKIPGTWLRAAEARNWQKRAAWLDALIVELLALEIASKDDGNVGPETRAEIFLTVTVVLEHVADIEIRSADSAIFYSLCTHREWRDAARAWIERNKIDLIAAMRERPGARLLHAIACNTQFLRRGMQ